MGSRVSGCAVRVVLDVAAVTAFVSNYTVVGGAIFVNFEV